MLIEKAFLIIRIQKLLDESAFALQLKVSDHQSDDQRRAHHHEVSHKESSTAEEHH